MEDDDETEVKNILLEFVEPNRNNPDIDDLIPLDVKGWRFPNTRDHGQYKQPVCFWSGVTCDPVDGSITGLNLGNGFYIHQLLGRPGGELDDDDGGDIADGGHGDSSTGGIHRRYRRAMVLEEEQDWLEHYDLQFDNGVLPKKRFAIPQPPHHFHRHQHKMRRMLQTVNVTNIKSNTNITYAANPKIPPSLGKLTSLRFINLSHNHIQGTIPKNILNLPNLEIIDVQGNDLQGTFPHFESDAIRVLDLSKNRFYGPLDKDIFGHPIVDDTTAPYLFSIVKFDLSHNGLNGTIPLDGTSGYYNPTIEHEESLQKLQYFDLGYNLFSGTICNNIGNFMNLQGLFLEHNLLVGTIPKSIFRGSGIGAHPLPLVQLFLQQNQLSGTLNEGLATLPNLRELYVDGNKLTGEVPEPLCSSFLNNPFLNDTQSARGCEGICCPANSKSREGVAPCTPCPDDGGYHKYMGQHDTECREQMSETEILDSFFDQTNGDKWLDSSYNWEVGSPVCERKGVECNDEGKVSKITLPSVGLRGPIIPELGHLSELSVLDLPSNQLTGFLPSDLRFTPLKRLDIRGNRMQSVVPVLLCIQEGINGNGIGPPGIDFNSLYACENIVCPRGTYSSIGRAALPKTEGEEGIQCLPCYDDEAKLYIGRDECTDIRIAGLQFRREVATSIFFKSLPIVIASILLAVFSWKFRPKKLAYVDTPSDGIDTDGRNIGDDEDDVGLSLCERTLSVPLSPLQRWMSSQGDEDDVGDDWTAGYSDTDEVNPISDTFELPRSKSRLPNVI